jgi:succinate dehydrogenase / fumarate reductase cytochrome b subunit
LGRLLLLYQSQLGKKAIVAVTGTLMLGFLLLHVAGNLKAFLPEASPGVPDIDVYSRFLRTAGEPLLPPLTVLWLFRVVLASALILHVVCVLQLAAKNRRARPVHYDRVEYVQTTRSARWMLYTGSLLLLFVVLHLLHLTTGTLAPAEFTHGAVYANLQRAFGHGLVTLCYVAAMIVLALHLYHGAWSLFQSLGLDTPDRNRGLRRTAAAIALVVPLAFTLVPLAFFVGLMPPAPTDVARIDGSPE